MSKFKRRKKEEPEERPYIKARRERQNRPKPGPEPTHGAFVAAKRFREVPLDLRRSDDKAIAEWQQAVIADLGGAANLDMLQSSLLDRTVELMIILSCMGAYVKKHGPMLKDGNLQPCLRSHYISYCNAFRRCLESIYERSDKKIPPPLDLDDYIDAKYSKDESE